MQRPTILIYIPRVTNRHRYVFDLVAEHLGVNCTIISEIPDEKNDLPTAGINYSHTPIKGWVNMVPAGLLEMKGITGIPLEATEYEGLPCLFPLKKNDSLLPYDIFSAIFYCVSRYEEYLPFKPDKHGRFPHQASWQYQHGCLKRPMVEIWLAQMRDKLQEKLPGIRFSPPRKECLLTMDVDHPFKIYGKSFLKKWSSVMRSIISQPSKTGQYIRAAGSAEADPHNTLEELKVLSATYDIMPCVFFLLNNKGKYNSQTDPMEPAYRALIKNTASWARVGIHTSYDAASDAGAIYQEKVLIEKIADQPVSIARQHFLRFRLPGYYRYLLQADIAEDHSMGYAATPGFRAGVSRPFFWYDLEREEITELRVHPFACMDATFTYYTRASRDNIASIVKDIYKEAGKFNGSFSILLHNDHLSGEKGFASWTEIIKALKIVDN